MKKNKGKRIGVVGNHLTTVDLINELIREGYVISCIINMNDDLKGEISGYVDLAVFARRHKIKIIRPKTYSLKHEEDIVNISKEKLDILLVFGWQRLIPEWLLTSLSIGAFGTHGSWKPLPYGRGRSLLNWGLIMGQSQIIDNLFRYDQGADSGDIIDSLKFSITPHDTIVTLHHKDQLVHQCLLLKHLPKIIEGQIAYKSQSKKQKEVFFPKRSHDDGVIDWRWKTDQLYNLIRALKKPYPGAYTFYKNRKIMIWGAKPFDLYPDFISAKPGEVIASFSDSAIVVRTGDGALYVDEYEADIKQPSKGLRFESKKNRSYEKLKDNGII